MYASSTPQNRFALDARLLAVTLALVGFGLIMIYSTTGIVAAAKLNDPLFYLKRQTFAALLGLAAMFVVSYIPISFIRKISPLALPVALILLLLTIVPGLGDTAGGARRWINLGFVRFQPGEIVKLCFIIYFAGFLARHEKELYKFSFGVVRPAILIGLIGGLFLLQPDFGSFAVVAVVAFGMATVSGVRPLHMLMCAIGGVLAIIPLIVLSPYRMSRVISFLSPFADRSGKGYQLVQSLIAVGSGHVTGVGLGDSQQKLFFLPAAHTDFIFAVVAEELGFIGCCAVIIPFLYFLWRGLSIARNITEDSFCFALIVGMTLMIVAPALLNMGVVVGLLPTKGMVLPLIGYGGSSLVTCLIAIGILLGVSRSYGVGDPNGRAVGSR